MHYGWAIEILSDDGAVIDRAVVTPDWRAAVDWVHFDGVRAGILPPTTRTDPGTIEPVWDTHVGEPYVSGYRVTVGAAGRAATRVIPRRYLQRLAAEVSAAVAARHGLAPGTDLRWVTCAVSVPASELVDDDGFTIAPAARPWPIEDAPLAAFFAAASPIGTTSPSTREMPVFVPAAVVEELRAMARAAGDVETGGALLGRLHRDTACGVDGGRALFVEITAHVPAAHTVASATSLTFTAASWGAFHATVAARGRREIVIGWAHTHLDWCRLRNCPPERRVTCTGAHPFFSPEDVHLHATCFPAAYQVALLVSDSAATGGLTTSLYGWSEGSVVARAFHLLSKGAAHAENHPA